MAAGRDAAPRAVDPLLLAAVFGAATFGLLHLVFAWTWERWFQPADLEVAWFLGSRRSLATTQVTLAIVSLLLGLGSSRRDWRRRLLGAAALAGGAIAMMVAIFALLGAQSLLLGPVRLWPVALIAGAIVLALPALAGALAAGLLRPR